ncbi:putative protein kinase RLK-Pelle-LRR-I-1 family [Helianthus debilis subsp. tardiflorus]
MASATFAHLQIPLEDVKKGTDNFAVSNIIGKGGFGAAYKGQLLWSGKSIKIAALRLDRKLGLGGLEFWNEISVLSDLKHTNLVSLIGFCDENHEKIIVIKHEENGSLREHLNNPNLTLTQRLRISVGVARALSYLYHDEGRGYSVIHCNINTSTILLDHDWEAKLSGFTFSIKQSDSQIDQVVLCEPIGIAGYVDPAIEKIRGASHTSDIYSFGVVLCEMLCGREAFIPKHINSVLAPLVKDLIENHKLLDIIPLYLHNQMVSRSSWYGYAGAAYSCINDEPAHRPNIKYTLAVLEEALELQLKRENQILGNNLEHFKTALRDIKSATENFSEKYGINSNQDYNLYKAELDHFDVKNHSSVEENKGKHQKRHNTVVIKRFFYKFDPQGEERFYTNIRMLTSVKHRNIVTLLGFCVEACEMILVIENSHEYLNDALMNIQVRTLTWEKRLKICINVAHALKYLHSKMIIHRDICPWTIVLDENLGAKIDDFFYSVLSPTYQEDKPLCLESNGRQFYYIDQEYEEDNKLKSAYDVYSFGVVLFEVLCGKLANHPIYLTESEKGLSHVVTQRYNMGTLKDMVDPLLIDENNIIQNRGPNQDSLDTFIAIAFRCMAKTQDKRPTMENVTQELEKALYFQEHQETPDVEQVVDKHEKTPERANESIHEERIQCPNPNQIVDELETALEVKSTHAIPGKNLEHLKIHLTDIKFATNNFSETCIIGYDELYTCYRAELENFYKQNPVVVKRFSYRHGLKREKEFATEIEVLTRAKHPNIVTLLGFCVEGSEMIIVIDNLSNGFLGDYFLNYNKLRLLTWEKRLKICIDVGHALNYVHSGMEDQKTIINRDICCRNIGLDENWTAKIVNFYVSMFLHPSQVGLDPCSEVRGRPYYIDPEYKKTSKLQRESDVYSFGVVLFEILCGNLACHPVYRRGDDDGLASIARRRLSTGTLQDMIDPTLYTETSENNVILKKGPNKDSLHIFINIANHCLAETQIQRPTMNVVIEQLKKALFFQKYKDNRKFSLIDIKRATQNFHDDNFVGGGGFGKVYKGNLQDSDRENTIVAKRLDTRLGQGEQQFWNELQILLEYKHENIIGLVGYCDEDEEKIIVYQYAPRGSLDMYLNNASLTWVERLNICIDVASALDFLHGGVGKQAKVIHRDIKTANILLNNDGKAKLADFGLSLISPITQKTYYVLDNVCGTLGYLDPHYKTTGFLTIESDIYSFGVVLFEILCGRSTYSTHKHQGKFLSGFIKNKFKEGKQDELVFEQIREQINPKSLTIFQRIAYQCLHHEREKRLTTKKVLVELKKALEFQNMASTMTKLNHLHITLEDIITATNSFHSDNIIGHHGFGTTYTGQLSRSGTLLKIAARRFDYKHGEGDLKFLKEISMLSDLKHTNLVSVIGFSDEKDEKVIITKYEGNGSLGQYLNISNLTWTQRLRICLGVARALSYLHYDEGRDYTIIHGNVNSDAILLDENWEAKLSSFEFSIKHLVCYKDHVGLCEHTSTMGYMDPAIEKTGGVTHESDVYSFGVVLFETLCGRKAYVESEADRFLTLLAKYHYENKTMHDIIHPDLVIDPQSLIKYSAVAYSCLNEDRACRPGMNHIVGELEKALELHLSNENMGINLEYLKNMKIRLTDIIFATDNFSKKYIISSSPCYTCYTAKLKNFEKQNHSSVVIKRFVSGQDFQHGEHFVKEIELLTRVKHPNIVTLLGFCIDASERILVLENFDNFFLDYHLIDTKKPFVLTWGQRLKICIDIAHALNYLHSRMIIHRDICSLNIELDQNWGAKISNFDNFIYLPPNQEDEALYLNKIAGRVYYVDPEYDKTGKLKRESDVYSFGVVLLEILCGRVANDSIYETGSAKGLVVAARRSFCAGTLEEMIDPILKGENGENNFVQDRGPNKDSLRTFIEIAYRCVAETQDQRPTMKVVVKELKKALFFQETS